jgi:putative hydrolase of the HAD superfamily
VSLAEIDFARVRVVTFDVGGTLLAPHPGVGAVYAELLGRRDIMLSPKVIDERFRQAFQSLSQQTRAIVNEAAALEFWREIVHRCVTPECPAALLDAVFPEVWGEFAQAKRWRALPGAESLIQNLGGRQAAVLSNWDARLHRVFAELNWTRHFQRVFVSSEIGTEKPDVRAFRAVERALKLAPKDFLHVGDSLEQDYHAAHAAGWQTVLVAAAAPPQAPATARVTRLDDLRAALA